MPSAIKYVPPTDVGRGEFAYEVSNERRVRRSRYEEALKYYEGKHPDQLEFDADEDEFDPNSVINLVQMTADRTTSFLFPKLPDFETDPASIEDTPEEAYLKKFMDANGGLHSLIKLALRGFLAGHSFIRVKPPKKVKANGLKAKVYYPIMSVLDPTTVTVYWKADDVAAVLWYETRYMVGETVYIQDFVHNEETDFWDIYTYRSLAKQLDNNNPFVTVPTVHGSGTGMGNLSLDMMDFFGGDAFELFETAKHTSEIPPIIEFAHLPHPDDYYGMGEFTQKTLQDTINRIMSLRNLLVSENADPVDVAIGVQPDEVQRVSGLVTIDNPQAKVQRLELKGDLAGISETLDKLIETYLAVARVVLLKGEAKDLQRVTNASVRTLFLDALSKNELLQASYGAGLIKVAQVVLEMAFNAGYIDTNPVDLEIGIKFPTPLPTDDTEIANQNAIMLNAGAMSLRTAASRMGLDWKFETAAMETEVKLANENALAQGEIAAENAKKMADAMPAPAAGIGGKPPAGKPAAKPAAKPAVKSK